MIEWLMAWMAIEDYEENEDMEFGPIGLSKNG